MTTRRALPSAPLSALLCALLCVLQGAGAACASAPPPESRALPTGLSSLSELLVGCERTEGADGAQRLACLGDVDVDVRPAGDASLARFRERVNERATSLGAQVVWDDIVVPTEAANGSVTRARALLPLNDTPTVTWLGVARPRADGSAEELSCSSMDERGDGRCVGIMGALLSRPAADGLPTRPQAASTTTAFGRAISLPTTCAVREATRKSGAVRCDDGVQLAWTAHASMEDAVQALHAQLEVSSASAQGEAFGCTILGEVGQCEERSGAIAGATYVDGEAVTVLCIGAGKLKAHGACRALMLAQ